MNSEYYRKYFLLLFVVISMTAFSCSGDQKGVEHIPVKEHGTTPAYTATYVCPMHCAGSGGDRKGICPSCGMNYVKLTEHLKNGHTH